MNLELTRSKIDAILDELDDKFEDYSMSSIVERLGLYYDIYDYIIRTFEVHDQKFKYESFVEVENHIDNFLQSKVSKDDLVKNLNIITNNNDVVENIVEFIDINKEKINKAQYTMIGFVCDINDMFLLDTNNKQEYQRALEVLKQKIKYHFNKKEQTIVMNTFNKHSKKQTYHR